MKEQGGVHGTIRDMLDLHPTPLASYEINSEDASLESPKTRYAVYDTSTFRPEGPSVWRTESRPRRGLSEGSHTFPCGVRRTQPSTVRR